MTDREKVLAEQNAAMGMLLAQWSSLAKLSGCTPMRVVHRMVDDLAQRSQPFLPVNFEG